MALKAGLYEMSREKGASENVIKTIRDSVHAAGASSQKIAMFHFQVLKNPQELEGLDPGAFCREIGVLPTYAKEFRKMISLARLIKEQGVRLV